ncbi:PKD domain-containing protein [Adhaeribacter terreus]|uniref:PKD domain-containing protein n=1 Tax=Adhaeribacter terreus TaxID=529703 RepID=A0ABW0E9Q8_9BACT
MKAYSSSVIRFFLILLAGINLVACKGNHSDEPAPSTTLPVSAATANFSSNLQLADVKQTVTFTNLSTNATRYTWYFGDGDSAHTVNGSHKYLHPGKYNVILKAYDNQNVPAIKNLELAVGERFINGFVLNKLKFTDSTGTPWDNGSGPDVWIGYMKISLGHYTFMRRVKNDFYPSQIPLTLALHERPFLNENYQFVLDELDSVSTNSYTSRRMATWILNPVQATKWDSVTQTGYLELKNKDYEVRFNLMLK